MCGNYMRKYGILFFKGLQIASFSKINSCRISSYTSFRENSSWCNKYSSFMSDQAYVKDVMEYG